MVSIDFIKRRLSSTGGTIEYSFSEIKSVTKSLSQNLEEEWKYPLIVDTTKKSSFVLIAESEEIRELWNEAIVNIFRYDTTAPKLSADDDSTKELKSLA